MSVILTVHERKLSHWRQGLALGHLAGKSERQDMDHVL